MIPIEYFKGKFAVSDQSSVDTLRKGYFGQYKKPKLILLPEEALYLMEMRNAQCYFKGKSIKFNEIAAKFSNTPKFAARYFTYKDWRDRGLIIKPKSYALGEHATEEKLYPAQESKMKAIKLKGTFFSSDLMSVLEESTQAKKIYDDLWLGQYGSYKAPERGKHNKLDIYETMYLISKGYLKLGNATKNDVREAGCAHRKDFNQMYSVYAEWRDKGYVIKTGFKFGTHFRVYFPGARPQKSEDSTWVHSKHVLHVFPKGSSLLISEWARAIRVAHSVKKTFILAVPGAAKGSKAGIDFVMYHRKGGDAESPASDSPRFAMLSLGEEEYLGGADFASAIRDASNNKLELIVAIADRETAVTYYRVKKIDLKGSSNDYFEIDWMQP